VSGDDPPRHDPPRHDPARPDAAGLDQVPHDAAPPDADPPVTGPALARAVLDAAKARRPTDRRRRTSGAAGSDATGSDAGGSDAAAAADGLRPARGSGWSGPGPDRRDPQPFATVLARLLKARGWEEPAAEATLFGQWERVVGSDVADRCRPVKLDGSELTIEAISTAWATQLRLLAGSILQKIAAEVGHNVVTRLRIHGPAAPSWNRGPRRVRGRGPRDTYG
jgi:predicted nucleic acid-binding Zn ribbon protein